jgi:hypothetical protein
MDQRIKSPMTINCGMTAADTSPCGEAMMLRVNRFARATRLGICAALVAHTALGHHSGAMFDRAQKRNVTGTVRTPEWANPHVWLWVFVPDSNEQVIYAFEGTSLGEMSRRGGWTKNSLKSGDAISVDYSPFREDAKKGGLLLKVTLADGTVLNAVETRVLRQAAWRTGRALGQFC